MLRTIHPLTKAVAIACSNSKLFPVPLSPSITSLSISPSSACTNFLESSTLSSRTSNPGRRKSPHPCVVLNASAARKLSTVAPCNPTTCPITPSPFFPSPSSFPTIPSAPSSTMSCPSSSLTIPRSHSPTNPVSNSLIPSTANAFVLLNTILFRIAFLSPGAGGFPVFGGGFFLILSVFCPLTFSFLRVPPVEGRLSLDMCLIVVVEKAAPAPIELVRGSVPLRIFVEVTEGRARHFQQLELAIASAAQLSLIPSSS
jgi:hypothetical protein